MDNSLEVLLCGMQFRKLMEKEFIELEQKYSLRRIDMQILFYLQNAGDYNTSRDILALNLFTKGHVSQSLTRIHQKGLIDMEHDDHDKRCVHIYLTERAAEIIDSLKRVYSEISLIVMADISDEERLQLNKIATKINSNISRVLADAE